MLLVRLITLRPLFPDGDIMTDVRHRLTDILMADIGSLGRTMGSINENCRRWGRDIEIDSSCELPLATADAVVVEVVVVPVLSSLHRCLVSFFRISGYQRYNSRAEGGKGL